MAQTTAQQLSQQHKQSGIAYITRTQMTLFIQGMSNLVQISFPQEVVRDLDIIDEQKLTTLLQTTIAQNKLPPTSITLLLANDLLFAKQMLNKDPSAQQLEEQNFTDMVPYEDVSVQHILFNNLVYITVANVEFYKGIIRSLEANNFAVPVVLAAYIFSKEVNFATPLTPQACTPLMQRVGSVKQYNFLHKLVPEKASQEIRPDTAGKSEEQPFEADNTQKKSNRVFILIGVFIMLIGLLIAVYLWSSQSNPPPRKEKQAQTREVTVSEPTPQPEEAQAPVEAEVPVEDTQAVQGASNIKVSLKFPASEEQNAVLVEDSLKTGGFTEVTKEETSAERVNETIISFNNSVSQELKNKIINAVSRVYEKVIVQNSNTFQTPAAIQLGKTN